MFDFGQNQKRGQNLCVSPNAVPALKKRATMDRPRPRAGQARRAARGACALSTSISSPSVPSSSRRKKRTRFDDKPISHRPPPHQGLPPEGGVSMDELSTMRRMALFNLLMAYGMALMGTKFVERFTGEPGLADDLGSPDRTGTDSLQADKAGTSRRSARGGAA